MSVALSRTLGDLVADSSNRAAILDRFGLDYCCHGQRSLADACDAAGLDAASVAAELDEVPAAAVDEASLGPVALTDHIESTHHRYLHAELPALEALADKVKAVHGERHPELNSVRELVHGLAADLEPHMRKEERILFPAIRALAAGTRDFPFGSIQKPITMMGIEHDRAGALLAELRARTDGYRVPDNGCASYRSLYERLEQVEADTHRHIHLENNVLFPAVVALEARQGLTR